MRILRNFILCSLLLTAANGRAQMLRTQPTPFTVWLDFEALAQPATARASFPIWLESVQIIEPKAGEAAPKKQIRLRLRRFAGLSDELLLRLFFEDAKASAPVVSAWTELGTCLLPPKELGTGIGLPTSETLIIAASQADYIEIDVPANAPSLPRALLASLKKVETRQALDFATPLSLSDPFDAPPLARLDGDDTFLSGRVKATLEKGPLLLTDGSEPPLAFEFELETPPLLAVLTFEVLNVNLAAPPEVIANDRSLGAASVILPDLADPAYAGETFPAQRDVRFHYTGWLKCQRMVPGSSLRAGANSIQLKTADRAGAVAIRSVEVQLKYATEP